jgi:hypothetical protein
MSMTGAKQKTKQMMILKNKLEKMKSEIDLFITLLLNIDISKYTISTISPDLIIYFQLLHVLYFLDL